MKSQRKFVKSALVAALSAVLTFAALPASAHCDGIDGPVVKSAQQALEAGDVNRALIWVKPQGEAEVRSAFQKAREVRKLNATAKELADRSFFETLVRVHRAGEGAPYEGLHPAGRDLGPALAAGDKAVESGSVKPVLKLLGESVHEGVEHRYREMVARKSFRPDDVAAGREYVEAYVDYIHAVENIHKAAAPAAGHAEHTEKPASAHKH